MGLPVTFLDEIKCSTKACNIMIELAARKITVHAAIIEMSQFGENVLWGNDVLNVWKPVIDFRSKFIHYLDWGPCLKCLGSSNNHPLYKWYRTKKEFSFRRTQNITTGTTKTPAWRCFKSWIKTFRAKNHWKGYDFSWHHI